MVEPSLFDVKTIPIIILPKEDPPSIHSPYDDGVSVVVDEDHDLYLPRRRAGDRSGRPLTRHMFCERRQHMAPSLWASTPGSSRRCGTRSGDGDADKAIVARGPSVV